MGQKTQYQKRVKQAKTRKARRDRLIAKGENIAEYFYGKFYLKAGEKK